MLFIKENSRGIIFNVFIQPRSSKNMVTGLYNDALKIKLKAPPVDGAANKMCLQFLAKRLKVPKSSLEIISGHSSRSKRILWHITDKNTVSKSDLEQIKRAILSLLPSQKTA